MKIYHLAVVADSWPQLRRCDVYRLFNCHHPKAWKQIYEDIKANRSDLEAEARECWDELGDDQLLKPDHS